MEGGASWEDQAIHHPPALGFAPRRLEVGEFSPTFVKGESMLSRTNPDSGLVRLNRREDRQNVHTVRIAVIRIKM